MCFFLGGPALAGLSLIAGVGQAIMGHQAATQAAEQQNEYYMQNAEAANRAAAAAYAHQQNAILQSKDSASQEIFERRIEALRARSTARNAAGEAGVTGLSVDALLQDYYGREGRGVDSVRQNFEITRGNLMAQMESTRAGTEARINSVQRAKPPSFADAALRILGAGLNAATVYRQYQYPYQPGFNSRLAI